MTNINYAQYAPMMSGDELRNYLRISVKDIAQKVGSTMGAAGKTSAVLMYEEKSGFPIAITTKDGSNSLERIKVSSVRSQTVRTASGEEVPYAVYALAAAAIHSVASQTEKQAGDGTTATTVIAGALFEAAMENFDKIGNINQFAREIRAEAELIAKQILDSSFKDIEEKHIIAIATTSLNHDTDAGYQLGSALFKAGQYGFCFVEGSKSIAQDRIEMVEGYTMNSWAIEPLFFNNKGVGIYNNPLVVVSKDPLDYYADAKNEKPSIKAIAEIYGKYFLKQKDGQYYYERPLVIFAPSVAGSARESIETSYKQGAPIIYVTFNHLHQEQKEEILEDIAKVTGAKLFSQEEGLHLGSAAKVPVNNIFGEAARINVQQNRFYLHNPKSFNNIEDYKQSVKGRIDDMESTGLQLDEVKMWLKRRLAALSGGIVRVTVSGSSDAELAERVDAFTDAQLACLSAMKYGIVTGGGITLHDYSFKTSDEVISKALYAPYAQILKNAKAKTETIQGGNIGFDVLTNTSRDFWQEPMIIDPAESVANALLNGVDIALNLLKIENLYY